MSPARDDPAEDALKIAIDAVADAVRRGPFVEWPSPLGAPGRFARRILLRAVRPLASQQREVDERMISALRQMSREMTNLRRVNEHLRERLDGGLRDEALHDFDGVDAAVTWYLGRPFVYPTGNMIGETIAQGREWDPALRTVARELVDQPQPSVCEIGANIGASLRQIVAAQPEAKVVAFEPLASFRRFLVRNIELAGKDGVDIVEAAAGPTAGTMSLYEYEFTASRCDLREHELGTEPIGEETVAVTTVDALFEDRALDLMKIDADGSDFDVLRGAARTLEREAPVIYFELAPSLQELAGFSPLEYVESLAELGYRRFVCLHPIEGTLVGCTEDPARAVAWAEEHSHCDVVTCRAGTPAAERAPHLAYP